VKTTIKRSLAFGGVAVLAISLAACSSGGNNGGTNTATPTGGGSAAASGKAYNIGVLVFDTTVPYFTPMVQGSKDAAAAMGATLDIQNGQGDLATEIAIINQFIAQKKDALVLTVSDGQGVVPALQAAFDAGIPVIANNTVINDPKVVTYVGSDNVTVGKTLADAVCQNVPADGKIAVILGVMGSSPQVDRLKGLEEGLKATCAGVTILDRQTANWDNQQALAVGQDFLTKYGPGKIDAIVDEGPELQAPALWAKENGRTDVKFIGVDVPTAVAPLVKAGTITAQVWQSPYEQGYWSVEDAINWLNGAKEKVPTPNHYSVNQVITKDNVDSIKPY
jgi:ABC-type sugar transport system substrate-binding protein